jgi:hypothetical protein
VTQALKYFDATANEPALDRRRAKRLFLNFPIEISGVDGKGEPFVERTKTEDISDTGCRLVTTIPFKSDDVVDIRLAPPPGTRLPVETAVKFEIMWVQSTGTGWSIGARQIQDGEIWKVSFPPPRFPS